MRDVAIRFLTFHALNDHSMIYWGLAVTWLILLIATVMSLRQQAWTMAAKWGWFLLVVLLPIAGLALYAFRCLFIGDWSGMKFLLGPSKSAKSVRA